MYVNPFWLGIAIGVISTIIVEVVGLVIYGLSTGRGDKNE